ncbi:hypothetical protein NKH77_32025 [Streptomyces sp. M19]
MAHNRRAAQEPVRPRAASALVALAVGGWLAVRGFETDSPPEDAGGAPTRSRRRWSAACRRRYARRAGSPST